MRDLQHFSPDYVVHRGDSEDRCPEAHRVVRNAVAVAGVLHDLPSSPVIRAMSAVEHAETPHDGIYILTAQDAYTLATVLEQVHSLLQSSLDREWRPQGPAAKDIIADATLPSTLPDGSRDPDRVFEISAEGRVALQYPRMSLPEFCERLPEVAAFLRRAGERGEDVLVDD